MRRRAFSPARVSRGPRGAVLGARVNRARDEGRRGVRHRGAVESGRRRRRRRNGLGFRGGSWQRVGEREGGICPNLQIKSTPRPRALFPANYRSRTAVRSLLATHAYHIMAQLPPETHDVLRHYSNRYFRSSLSRAKARGRTTSLLSRSFRGRRNYGGGMTIRPR